ASSRCQSRETALRSAAWMLLASETGSTRIVQTGQQGPSDCGAQGMIFWRAGLVALAAAVGAIGLWSATLLTMPASSPARAQDGHVVVYCFDPSLGTVTQTLA